MRVFKEGRNIRELFDKHIESLQGILSGYDFRQLRDFSESEIQAIVDKCIIENIEIDFDNPTYETKQGKKLVNDMFGGIVEVDSIDVIVKIPVLNGINILSYKGNPTSITLSYIPTEMRVVNLSGTNYLSFTLQFSLSEIKGLDSVQIKSKVDHSYKDCIDETKFYYEQIIDEIDKFNSSLKGQAKLIIRDIVEKESLLESFSNAIGVNVNPKNDNREKGHKITIAPKKASATLPSKRVYEGYYLDNANYNAVLQTIREHLIATEELPKAIQKLNDEEMIRDTILWALNANYIIATGETFRAAGKTDIHIKLENKSAFVAECKIWKGPSTFDNALSQIFSYTTWRDCRVAIIIFNTKYKNFGDVIKKLNSEISNNKEIITSVKKGTTEWECKFRHPADNDSFITVNVFVSDYCLRKE